MSLTSSWLYTCVLQYMRREGWTGREDKKMHVIPCFPLSRQPQSRDQHWIGTYCALGTILLHIEIKGSAQ